MAIRKCAPLSEIPKALEKTGFLLEHAVAEEFRGAGWSVIGNRYYVDDVDERTRELDLVAYRVKKLEDVEVLTGVLVSCKKDAENTWAFLTKDKPAYDPNIDWEPVHYWTDFEPLASHLSSSEWRRDYIHGNPELFDRLFNAKRSVFAFQQISPSGTAPKNDKAIFDSISSLLKALDHELSALPSRVKGRKRIYLFTLATIVDAPMVDVQYQAAVGRAVEIDGLVHVARYMVRKRELSAHIHFVRSDRTKEFVASMGRLAEHNASQVSSLVLQSFDAIRRSRKVRAYFAKELERRLRWRLNYELEARGTNERVSTIELDYDGQLSLQLDIDLETAKALERDPKIYSLIQDALAEIARYEGKFKLTCDVPF